jgi:tetratricopeptide (TPR) repeat protein
VELVRVKAAILGAAALAAMLASPAIAVEQTATPKNQITPSPRPSLNTGRGLADFASPLQLTPSPSPGQSPSLDASSHYNETWARLVGKSYGDVILEANRAYDSGDYARAVEINSFALQMPLTKPQASVATMNRGNAFAALGQYDRAMRDLDESVTLDPRNAGGYVNRALVLGKQGDGAAALKDYEEALRIDPKQWQAYYNRARAYLEEGAIDRALADLDAVIEQRPNFLPAFVYRSNIWLQKGEDDKALSDANTAITLEPKSAEARLTRARVYLRARDFANAEKELEAAATEAAASNNPALRSQVNNTLAWFRATATAKKLRNGPQAVKLATEACDASQWKTWQYVDTLAAAYAQAGNFVKAREYAQKVLKFDLPKTDRPAAEQRLKLYRQGKPYRDDFRK